MKLILLALLLASHAEAGNLPLEKALCPFNKKLARSVFSRETIHETPIENYEELFKQQSQLYGKCISISKLSENSYSIQFQNATLPFESYSDDSGRLGEINFGNPIFSNDSFEKIQAASQKQMPNVSIFAAKNSNEIFAMRADTPLNISKSSWLLLAAALQEKIQMGKIAETDIVRTNRNTRLTKFGLLHSWPENSPLTISSLKNLMLIESDNTAADLLLEAIGRPFLEERIKTAPFLSSFQLAVISAQKKITSKTPRDKILDFFVEPNEAVDSPEERYDLVGNVGWFASTKELCKAANILKNDPSFGASLQNEGEKNQLKFKGHFASAQGRDSGVVQNTLIWQNEKSKDWLCLSITANDSKFIDENIVASFSARLFALMNR